MDNWIEPVDLFILLNQSQQLPIVRKVKRPDLFINLVLHIYT